MSWTAPRSWTTGEIITAAIMNTHVRDNFLTTAPAVASAVGDMFIATAANAIKKITLGGAGGLLKVNSAANDAEWLAKGPALYYLRVNSGGTDLEWGEIVVQKPRGYHKTLLTATAGAGQQKLTVTGKGRLLALALKNASSTAATPDFGVTIDGIIMPVSTVNLAAGQYSAPARGFICGSHNQFLEMSTTAEAAPKNAETEFDTSFVITLSQNAAEDGPAMMYVAYELED